MKLTSLPFLATFATLALSQDLNSTSSSTNYDSLYKGRCAESTSTTETSIYPRWQIQWSPYTGLTDIVTRRWTTIYPSPTPTSFPATVKLTHISSATGEGWATRSNGEVEHSFVTMVVVSFEYERTWTTAPTGLAVCKTIG